MTDIIQENTAQKQEADSFHHDLRTQLSAIVSLSLLIKKSSDPTDCTPLLEALHLAANNAMAMMEGGAEMREAKPKHGLTLMTLLNDFGQVAKGIAEARGAHFQLEMHDALKSSAFASPDPTYFNRLFTLLLDNSIKYAPGSEITLTASIEDGNQLALDFADNGPGFGVADPSLLFEPYQRGESAEGVAGTGMGLWSVKTIVQMMNGKIWAAGNKPTGAIFFIRLPLDAVTNLPAETAKKQLSADQEKGKHRDLTGSSSRSGLSGLIVDDNSTNQLIIAELLKAMGFSTRHASSGEDALSQINSEKPDFALLDIRMDGMDGWELADQIRQRNSWKDVPLIGLSSDPIPAELGPFDGWMQRPVDPEKLQIILNDLIET